MKTVVLGDPPEVLISLIANRKRLGLDTHDEVWNGEYHMAPAANFQHGKVIGELVRFLGDVGDRVGLTVTVEFNLGDLTNFRVPDLGLHRSESTNDWLSTAAVVVEVRSPDDESYAKFDFYFEHGVEEILIADLTTKRAHWFLRGPSEFEPASRSDLLGLTTSEVASALGWQRDLSPSAL